MALINITPKMTSNTMPTPYVASCSSKWDATYEPFRCFSGAGYWCSANGVKTGWIALDFSQPVKISAVKINTAYTLAYNPKDIAIEGLGSDNEWELIEEIIDIKLGELYTFLPKAYSKIRISIDKTIGGTNFACLGQVTFYYDDLLDFIQTEHVSHQRASLAYTLPMSTTRKILGRRNDEREGLLVMANDPDHYGDLYVVGQDGRAHLTQSGMKSEVIFEGKAKSIGSYELAKGVTQFKFLNIIASVDHTNEGVDCYKQSNYIPVSDISFSDYNQFTTTMYSTNYIAYGFPDENTLKVGKLGTLTSGWESVQIKKIIGIY